MRPTTVLTALVACGLAILAANAASSFSSVETRLVISQKGRRFGPSDVHLKTNENLYILNDDGDLIHDAYVDSPDFSVETGDINPGATAVITFPKEGGFQVLCGIHPSMKLAVHVYP